LFDSWRFHAFLVLAEIAFKLTRAAAVTAGPTLAKATTATIRRKLVAVPARLATAAKRITLHLPQHWPWEIGRSTLFIQVCDPPSQHPADHPADDGRSGPGTPGQRGPALEHDPTQPNASECTHTRA
jgi:hypothetical protein